jgi:hypothetical protein
MVNTKLLGLPTDNQLTLKNNEDQMIPRLSGTCYAVRSIFHISNINTLKPVYLNFLGLLPKIVKRYFTEQGIRIMVGAKCRHSYSSLFK